MHEMAMAESILDIALRSAPEATKITLIKVIIGEMSGLVPESLHFCFDMVTKGSPAEGAKLEMEITPLLGNCRDCGAQFPIENYRFICPKCNSAGVEITSGRELRVDYLEVD